MFSTRDTLGDRCGDVRCTQKADRTVLWTVGGLIAEVTYECRKHAIQSATDPTVMPGYRFGGVFAGLRNVEI